MSTATEELLQTFETVAVPCDIGRSYYDALNPDGICQHPAANTAMLHHCITGGAPVTLCGEHTTQAVTESLGAPDECKLCKTMIRTPDEFIWNILPLHPKGTS